MSAMSTLLASFDSECPRERATSWKLISGFDTKF